MATINRLTAVDSVQDADLFPIYSASNGDARKSALSVLRTYLQSNLTFSTPGISYETIYSAPVATGFSVAIPAPALNYHLILTPAAAYAAGSIVLPGVTNLIDKQELLVNSTQAVTTLTVVANGAVAVKGAPAGLAQNGFFRIKYNLLLQTWYRVG